MNRRRLCVVLAALPLSMAASVRAQSNAPFRIAWVTTDRKDAPLPNLEAFRAGLRELGHVEGKHVAIEVWSGDGSGERIGRMAGEIVASRPDVVVAAGGAALFPLVRAGVTLPTRVQRERRSRSRRRSPRASRGRAAHMTGISLFALTLVGKRLELIKEFLPGAKRVALVCNPQHPGEHKELAAAREGASKLGLEVRYFPTNTAAALEAALAEHRARAGRCNPCLCRRLHPDLRRPLRRVLDGASHSGRRRLGAVRPAGQPDDLRPRVRRRLSPPRRLRRQDPQGREARASCRSSCRPRWS